MLDLTICGPLKSWLQGNNAYHPANDEKEVDFDDPYNAPGTVKSGSSLYSIEGGEAATLKAFERTRLRIQLRFHAKLIIPFANWIIFRSWTGMGTGQLIRMGDKNASILPGASKSKRLKYDIGYTKGRAMAHGADTLLLKATAVSLKRYFIPLYANYGFRMQSNFYLQDSGCEMPTENKCHHYKSDDTSP